MVEADKPQLAAGQQERIWRARDVMHAFQKLLKTGKMFSPSHPQYDHNFREFSERLAGFHEEFGALRLQVSAPAFAVEGQPVLEEERGLPFRLFLSGIRELNLAAGIAPEELQELVRIALQETGLADDDLVTLLWKKNLPHVSYFALDELYESWGGEEEETLDQAERENLRRMKQGVEDVVQALASRNANLSRGTMRYTVSEQGAELEQLAAAPAQAGAGEPEAAAAGAAPPAALDLLDLAEAERQALRADLAATAGQPLVDKAIAVALDLLQAGENRAAADGAGPESFLELCLLRALEEGDLPTLNALLGRLAQAGEQAQKLRERLVGRLGEEGQIALLLRALNGRYLGGLQEAARYLEQLGVGAVETLCRHYAEVGGKEERQVVREFLVARGPGNPRALRQLIEHQDPAVHKDGIFILGRMEGAAVVELVPAVLRREDARIREYGMLVLSRVNLPAKLPLLLEALRDREEKIRVQAARQMGEVGDPSVFGPLRQLAGAEEFTQRSPAEQEAILLALARTGGRQAASFLDGLAGQRSFFHRRRTRDLARLARQARELIKDA